MKKIALLLAILMLFAFVGCTADPADTSSATEQSEAGPVSADDSGSEAAGSTEDD